MLDVYVFALKRHIDTACVICLGIKVKSAGAADAQIAVFAAFYNGMGFRKHSVVDIADAVDNDRCVAGEE